MSRTTRTLLVAIVALLAVGGYWKLVLAPKREQVTQLDHQVAAAQAQLAQTQSTIATYKGAKAAYKGDYTTVVRLGEAVPSDDDTRSLIVQLNASAARSGISFDTMDVTASSTSALTTPGSTPTATLAPGALNAGSYAAMPFTLGFSGNYATLANFLGRLQRMVTLKGNQINVNGRLLRVESISLKPGQGGWPALQAQVAAASYILPEDASTGVSDDTSTSTSTTTSGTTAASPSGSSIR